MHVEQRREVQATFHERELAIRGAFEQRKEIGNRKGASVFSGALKVKKGGRQGIQLTELRRRGTGTRIRNCKGPRPPTRP